MGRSSPRFGWSGLVAVAALGIVGCDGQDTGMDPGALGVLLSTIGGAVLAALGGLVEAGLLTVLL